MYFSSKTYGHNTGLSCAFRQWRADSHCRFLHGYALKVELIFSSQWLDTRNWVQDFGGLKEVKEYLQAMFDHKTVVAADDPNIEWFKQGAQLGTLDLIVVQGTGCELFAEMIFDKVSQFLTNHNPNVTLVSVQVWEHEANSAKYTRDSNFLSNGLH